MGLVLAHPAHDPVYEGIREAFNSLGWVVCAIVPPHAQKEYTAWKQVYPNTHQCEVLEETLSEAEIPAAVASRFGRTLDLIIYDDYKGRPEIFASVRSRCPLLLIAHNVRRALQPIEGKGFQSIELNRPRRNGLRRLDGLLVLSDTIAQYAQEQFKPARPLLWIPDSVFYQNLAFNENHNTPDARFTIAVPGNLTKERKDFPPVLKALAKLRTENRRRMNIRFIGGIGDESGKEIADELEALKQDGVPLTYSRTMLTDLEFEEQMRGVDLLIQPVPQTVAVDGFLEEYNRTKISGTVGHQIRRGLPVLQPKWCPADQAFASSTGFYESAEELLEILDRLFREPAELAAQKELALENARQFSPERIAKHIQETILSSFSLD
ncbi:MAG: hypothetical protein ACFCU1_00090 [Sumerlaeia bacterium]